MKRFCVVILSGLFLVSHLIAQPADSSKSLNRQDLVRELGGSPKITLASGRSLDIGFKEQTDTVLSFLRSLTSSLVEPLGLASGDFDEDGMPDLLCAYQTETSGFLSLSRGNVDALWPYGPRAIQHRKEGTFTDSPFLPTSELIQLPVNPRFLGTGHFNGDDHLDVVVADVDDSEFWMLAGRGDFGFNEPVRIDLPGTVSVLATGKFGRAFGVNSLVVGLEGSEGPLLQIYRFSLGNSWENPEEFQLPTPATSLAFGRLNPDGFRDLAVVTESQVSVISAGLENRIESHFFSSRVSSITIGDFLAESGNEMAVLLESGEIQMLRRNESGFETKSGNQLGFFQHTNQISPNGPFSIFTARVATSPRDELLILGRENMQLTVLAFENPDGMNRSNELKISSARFESATEIRAVLPMRLNKDAFDDLVIATRGSSMLNVISSRSGNVFVVNDTGDEDDADYEDNICDSDLEADDLQCTLRAALSQARQTDGADDILFEVSTLSPSVFLRSLDSITIDGRVLVGGEFSDTKLYLDGSNYPSGTYGSMVGVKLDYNNAVRNLVIGNFRGGGISGTGGGNVIEGNIVGTDITYTQDLGNRYGIVVRETNNVVGGTTPEAANVVGGFTAGILLDRDTPETDNNEIIGNYIGTDPSGTNNLRNTTGIDLVGASQNLIKGNLVKYNGYGVQIRSSAAGKSSNFNQLEGNTVSNNSSGISVHAGKADQNIGNTISRNSIFENNALGIDLGYCFFGSGEFCGVTPNDFGDPEADPAVPPDADDGPNELQNYPVLTRVQESSKIEVSLTSTPSTDFTIELFQNDSCDSSGHGEGKNFIESYKVKTDSEGKASFEKSVPAGFITATATERLGELSFSTSEFSSCAVSPPETLVVNTVGDDPDENANSGNFDGICSTGKRVNNPQEICNQNLEGDCECTLRAAIQEANQRNGKDTINFNIPGSSPYKITLKSPLPSITDSVILDAAGDSSGYVDRPLVEIDGLSLNNTEFVEGLDIRTSDSLVRGLAIFGFDDGTGVGISGDRNELQGNFLVANKFGVNISGSNNTIGGIRSTAGSCKDPCNIFTGNDWGIQISSPSNTVMGNFIGLNQDGTEMLANSKDGIRITSDNNTIGGSVSGEGNIISGNYLNGILLDGASSNVIYGNLIGTDKTGAVNLGNGKNGILLKSDSDNNQIGGLAAGTGNTIAFNLEHGIKKDSLDEERNSFFSNSIFLNGKRGIQTRQSPIKVQRATVQPPKNGHPGQTFLPWGMFHLRYEEKYTVQFFSNASGTCPEKYVPPDELTEVEGMQLIGTIKFTSASQGDSSWGTAIFPFALMPGEVITATDTPESKNTSSFTQCFTFENDSDGDGIADEKEPGRENDPDSMTIDAHGWSIQLDADATETKAAVFDATADTDDDDVVLPGGLLDILLNLSESGATAQSYLPLEDSTTITLTIPSGMQVDSYYNYGPTPADGEIHWYEFLYDGTTGAEIFSDRIVLHFIDGQRGDHDLTENGQIQTRGGPVTNATTLYFPYSEIVTGSFTGFAVSNFSDQNAVVEFNAYDKDGNLVRQPNNPAIFGISAANQLALLANEIFETSSESVSWIKFKSDNPEVGSFFQVGGTGQLDGSVAQLASAKKLYFTRVFEGVTGYRGQAAKTYLSIANPDRDEMTVSLKLFGSQQDKLESESREPSQELAPEQTKTIPGRGFLYGTVSELFGGDLNVSSGYIEVTVTEGEGAVGFERIQLQNQSTVIGLGASTPSSQTDSYSAQLASIPPGWFTNIKLINTADSTRTLTITAIAEDGSNLADPVQIQLQAGELEEVDAVELFEFESSAVGSLKVEADGSGVIGDVVFGDRASFKYAASLPLQSATFTEAVFNQVASTDDFYTGLALFNPGSETANIKIEVYTAGGEKSGEIDFELGSGKRISKLLRELIPTTAGQVRGFIKVDSNVPLVAQELFGDINLNLLSSVPPTVVN